MFEFEPTEFYLLVTAGATICMQLMFFFIAYSFKFDKVTDFAGTMNFLLLACLVFFMKGTFFTRQVVLTVMVICWSVRLGAFLLNRVLRRQKDARFDEMRERFFKFLAFWIFQMVWVWVVSLPVTLVNSSSYDSPIGALDYIGWGLWVLGFIIESGSDHDKYNAVVKREQDKTKNGPAGFQEQTGFWYYSRHPNYFGEILLWLGISLSCMSDFIGHPTNVLPAYFGLTSPILTFLLLAFLSGMPLAESRADKRYKDSAEYKAYKLRTSPLIPFPPVLYSRLPLLVRRIFFLELPLYSKQFNAN